MTRFIIEYWIIGLVFVTTFFFENKGFKYNTEDTVKQRTLYFFIIWVFWPIVFFTELYDYIKVNDK